MTTTRTSVETDSDKLRALRAYYAQEIAHIDIALALLSRVDKMSKKVEKQVGQVRRRATGADPVAPVAPVSHNGHGQAPARAHAADRPEALTTYRRLKIAKQTGTRPTDVVRQMFVDAKGEELRQEDINDIFRQSIGRNYREDQVNRIVGLALRRLRVDHEIKQTRTGFIAKHLREAAAAE